MIRASIVGRVDVSLERLAAEARKRVRDAVQDTANDIVADVAGRGPHAAPYRRGHLRSSYYAEMLSDYEARVANNVEIAPYAIYVELGTRKMAARPHLKPAAEYAQETFIERIKAAL